MTIPFPQTLYPWQHAQWRHLIDRRQQHNLPHALLLAGAPGLGITEFALNFGKLLLCDTTSATTSAQFACGHCHACQLLQAGSHPDLHHLQPEAPGKALRIDPIRDLIAQLNQTAQQGRYKIAILEPAEAMQLAASNALLKILEEPSANTLFMLLSNQPGLLAATLRSRCQTIRFAPPSTIDAQQWLATQLPSNNQENTLLLLAHAEGAPLRALELATNTSLAAQRQRLLADLKSLTQQQSDPIQIAAQWSKEPLSEIVTTLIYTVMDIIRDASVQHSHATPLDFGQGAAKPSARSVQQVHEHARQASNTAQSSSAQSKKWFAYLDKLYQLRQPLTAINNLNQQLLLEDLLSTWYEYNTNYTR